MQSNFDSTPGVLLTQTPPLQRDQDIISYVKSWRDKVSSHRKTKEDIWTDCWRLYRGIEDWRDKEDWQAKITIPKSFNSVEQAASVIKRFLLSSAQPFSFDPINPDNIVEQLRAQQYTDLTKYFLENTKYIDEFILGLKSGFITGVGVWKLWWGFKPRLVTRVEPTLDPNGQPINQVIQREMMEGKLFLRAIDPYNFFWLPGSKFNQWVGTIENIEIPKWELMEMAKDGVFGEDGVDKVSKLQTSVTADVNRRTHDRFQESHQDERGPNAETRGVKLTEFYGPLVLDDGTVAKDYHCIIANDNTVLKAQPNPLWMRRPPYVAFSPLTLPFRTDGVGLIEMVRQVDKMISMLANLSVDTLRYKLLPVFEVNADVYENIEDFDTGMTPGKIFRRKRQFLNIPGINQVPFEDVSGGAIAVQGQLDRAHQEGALVSEIQQAIPRFRGYQSATEIEAKNSNIQSFFSAMAADIERQALAPIVEMAGDLVFQFVDTTTDHRVASILGVGADVLRGMTKEELMEVIQGDYIVKVTGISGQLEKAEMLESLVQFMNIIGQNSEAWIPYINQDALLRRILEAFRPAIRDLDQIIADPSTVEARRVASSTEKLTPEMIALIPTLVQQQIDQQRAALEAQQQQQALAEQQRQQALQEESIKLSLEKLEAEIDKIKAETKAINERPASPKQNSGS